MEFREFQEVVEFPSPPPRPAPNVLAPTPSDDLLEAWSGVDDLEDLPSRGPVPVLESWGDLEAPDEVLAPVVADHW